MVYLRVNIYIYVYTLTGWQLYLFANRNCNSFVNSAFCLMAQPQARRAFAVALMAI